MFGESEPIIRVSYLFFPPLMSPTLAFGTLAWRVRSPR
jgi:hypothetical protein